ncbi:uncharacterized protein LOC120742271 isoform X5 [Simochromis diagramma]|uniref:uncharacterized protein LOC120742271 isoform X5 n=1 Tax=Simochromis diagramma TaxID=43689 RepID=UPI001A7EC238|nr:uncharacterized protein LOC120742271 isoform X5 [Simochromis diagramma]
MMKMKMKMCALFVILALVSQHASGVEVFEGEESVLLPCNMVVPKDHAVVWKREDLSSAIVHAIVEGKDDLLNQNTRYSNRTSMSADALQTRDLSLTLRKPTFTDSGTYACVTRKHGADQQRTEVQLKVKERPPPPVWPIVLSAVLVPVVLLGAVVFFLLYCVTQREKLMTVGQLTPLEVTEGAPSVLLPYTHTCCLGEVVKVEWIFVTHENKKVCVFENGQIKRDQQHTDYRERAEMESFPPKEEKTDQLNRPEVDLSLTLRNPVCADGGVYLCILHDRAVNTMKLKLVPLLVKEPLMTTVRAAVGGRNKAAKRLPSFRVSKDAAVEAECAAGGQKALHGGALG